MTTLTVNIPGDSKAVIEAISKIVDKVGGNISILSTSDADDLGKAEFEALKLSYKEALLIKDGKAKSVPISELWDE